MSSHEQAEVEDKGGCMCGKADGHPRTAAQYHAAYARQVNSPGVEEPNGPPHKSNGSTAVAKQHRDRNTLAPEPRVPGGPVGEYVTDTAGRRGPGANPGAVGADSIAVGVKDGAAATSLAVAISTGDAEMAARVAAGLPPGADKQAALAVAQALRGMNIGAGFTDGAPIQHQDAGASPAYRHCTSLSANDAGRLQIQGNGAGTMGRHGWGSGRAR
jgi:hypothetical protein